ncbi:MAG: hypothetical protein U9Q72_03430 [Patescibacteria group bacterium]|nr:hypothetical protein [Patescibacteria group bacterium]
MFLKRTGIPAFAGMTANLTTFLTFITLTLFFFLFPFSVRATAIDITENTTWNEDQVVEDRVIVMGGATLTIEPGVQIKFKPGGNLRIYGDLIVEGEKNQPVIFFREKPKPEEERWMYYLTFGADSNSVIKHAIIKEAGGYSDSGSRMPGMKIRGNLEIYDSLITQNYWALEVRDDGHLKMRNSDIYDNHTTWGVEVLGHSAAADIVDNYWGDNSGPFHSSFNKLATGERINGGNLEFTPWETRGKKPIILIPGFGESLNFGKFFQNQVGRWWLFPPTKSTSALKTLLEDAGYEDEVDLFVGFYDWRKSIHQNATDYLKPIINLAKEKSGFKEVDIVAFSFGGLVSRSYVQGNSFGFDVNNLITLGTPHQGISKIYTFAAGGQLPAGWNPLLYIYLWYEQIEEGQSALGYIQNYLPSVYEIMPTYDFLKMSGSLINHQEMSITNNILQELNNGIGDLQNRVDAFFVGGTDQLTLDNIPVRPHLPNDGAFWLDGAPDPARPVPNSTEGDATVLTKSAIWGVEDIKSTLIQSQHEDLPLEAKTEIENILDIDLGETNFDFNYSEDYLIFCLASPLEVEIVDQAGHRLSREINEIENAYFYEEDPLGKKIILIYNPDTEYSMEVSGLANSDYRILAMSADANSEIVSAEISAEIALGENVEYWARRVVTDTEGNEQGDANELKIEIYEKIVADYKVLVGRVKDFYKTGFLKSWEVRQELLERILASYNFSKRDQLEEEGLMIEDIKAKVIELEVNELLDSSSSQLLLDALDEF